MLSSTLDECSISWTVPKSILVAAAKEDKSLFREQFEWK